MNQNKSINTQIEFLQNASLSGDLTPPGDKSISHRSVIFASLAKGRSVFQHFLTSSDCLNTLKAFENMGVKAGLEGSTLTIDGVGTQA